MFRSSTSLARVRLHGWALVPLALAVSALAACNARAGNPPEPASPPAAPALASNPTLDAPGYAGMTVQRDPVTGMLTPLGPAAARALLPLWLADQRPLDRPVEMLPDGSLMMDLTGVYLDFAVAERGWDGRLRVECDPPFVPSVLLPIELTLPARVAPGTAER